MKTSVKYIFAPLLLAGALSLLTSCKSAYDAEKQNKKFLEENTSGAHDVLKEYDSELTSAKEGVELPLRFQNPTYLLDNLSPLDMSGDFTIPVGADVSSVEPVPLRDIMKKLAKFHNMNISWASDTNQSILVDVDIRAEDDLYDSINNILRQVDYFAESEGNSIIIKYKDTKIFNIAMPFLTPTYETNVGVSQSDDAGSGNASFNMTNVGSGENSFDIWINIQNNLDKIFSAWQGADSSRNIVTIDKPTGTITVSAPRSLLEKVTSYIENLQNHIYRQISIEAKFIEVELSHDNTTGIDWSGLLSKTLNFEMDFQKLNPNYHGTRMSSESTTGNAQSSTSITNTNDGTTFTDTLSSTLTPTFSESISKISPNRFLTLSNIQIPLLIDFIREQGDTEILANPKISVMNGQPAMINVGTKTEYIKKIEETVEEGIHTYSTEIDEVMSGIALAVVANILGDDNIILNLTPITSEVVSWAGTTLGGGGLILDLPTTAVREMSTTVNIKSGETLVIGGLISSRAQYNNSGVSGLSDIPGIGKAFKTDGTDLVKKELIILLRPVIHPRL